MSATIIVFLPNGESRTLWIRKGQTVRIGRTRVADFDVINDSRMSSVHFCLECRPEGCFVRDLQSLNGTFLNEQRVKQSGIKIGDEVRAGVTRFYVKDVDVDVRGRDRHSVNQHVESEVPPLTCPEVHEFTSGKNRVWSDQRGTSSQNPVPTKPLSEQNQESAFDKRMDHENCWQHSSAELIWRTATDSIDFSRHLAANSSLLVILKAGMQIPNVDLRWEVNEFLYPWIPKEMVESLSPRVIGSKLNMEILKLLDNEFWGSDSVSLFCAPPTAKGTVDALRLAARGFHDPVEPAQENHMLKTFEPSHLANVLAECTPSFAGSLFETFEAIGIEVEGPAKWSFCRKID